MTSDDLARRLPSFTQWRNRRPSLSRRLVTLSMLSVSVVVLMVALGAYWATRFSLYNQLDNELFEVASYTAGPIASDVENMGGLNSDALHAANVTLILLGSDGSAQEVPGQGSALTPGAPELTVARIQTGTSARTVTDGHGVAFRMVAVPQTIGQQRYAVVMARPLVPTERTLHWLWITMLVTGGLGVLLAVFFGWWGSKQALRPLRNLSGAVAHVTETDELSPIAIHSDDELGDLTRSFNTMLNSLSSSRERQRRLIADAGHELRTPLTSMRTNIELLVADEKTGMLPEGARGEILHDIAAQLGEFTSLVGDLMQLSRDDAVSPSPEPLDFADVVAAAVDRVKRRGPNLTYDVVLEPMFIVGEPDTLERAVTNLLDNAVKFSPETGTVHVRLADGELTIWDEGPGIVEDDLPKIFDRFYRSNKARNTPGTGLGLAIVAHTINAHGGTVEAANQPGAGARFVVRLPASEISSDEDSVPVG